ncbi:MAG: hypothetical protein CEO22_639 [Candidatus Berkelbacteria bacterium Gr01-1014_85]|uniref:Uncharacterized protein n=1 Tax=Candidatus Berkelbacteria bacterium Gr01-1014_85 TaxID=2017150 RepID=A0A554J9J8_9BACT|nr:MAG: hypothetical protein CEO22_639 [Candidatus Berkelbacteria bacterium Gr01-1014_85]
MDDMNTNTPHVCAKCETCTDGIGCKATEAVCCQPKADEAAPSAM